MAVSRRSFLKDTVATAAVTMVSGSLMETKGAAQANVTSGPGNKWPGRVAVNFNKDAVKPNTSGNPTVDMVVVAKMVDDAIMFLTGESTVGAAWKAVFPATISATSTIAIKVPLGCASARMAPHWSSVKAIIDGLSQMDFGGTKFSAANVTIYEMECSDKFAQNGYTAANLPNVKIVRDSRVSGSTDGATSADGKTNYDYAKSLQSSFLINVFRPGGHQDLYGGFTLGFKNHFGTYPPTPIGHSNAAPGYLRDINCTGVVFNKNVLSICIGLFGAEEASGMPTSGNINYEKYVKTVDSAATGVEPRTIIMSTDPVSVEMQAIKLMRLNNGKKFTVADLPSYLKASGGIIGALSDKVYNIGVIDEGKMDVRKIINGERVSTGIKGNHVRAEAGSGRLHVKTLQVNRTTFIEFSMPHSIGSTAAVEVFDLKGARVYSIQHPVNGILNHLSWNEKTLSGNYVPNGSYIIKVTAGTAQLSKKISLLR